MLIPGSRVRYLAEIAEQGRGIGDEVEHKAELAATAQHCYEALRALGDPELPGELEPYASVDLRAAESLGSAPEAAHWLPCAPVQRRARGSGRGGARPAARMG